MLLHSTPQLSQPHPCAYLPLRQECSEFFLAARVRDWELDTLLGSGWRTFGELFFRPDCPQCTDCIPLRIPTPSFSPSTSQRRVLRKNRFTNVRFSPLAYRDEIYEIYAEHSLSRFEKQTSVEEFLQNFYRPAWPSLQVEYSVENRLLGVGFLSVSVEALSSVYFIYRDEAKPLSLGTFSVLAEVAHARALAKPYYYLGYYLQNNHHMAYKARFFPHQQLSWTTGQWESVYGATKPDAGC
jgi:arginine-tRNA-protein transferase